MANERYCNQYLDENYVHLVVEYRGDFKGQLSKIDYACGTTITDTLGVVAVQVKDVDRLRREVPAIIFMETRGIYVLQDIDPSNADNIHSMKINPYLNLTGKDVLVGTIDTGISYLNQEFIREDDTSRVLAIWDQTIQGEGTENKFGIGTVYSNEKINEAIKVFKQGGDPYSIVPSKDELDHGTKMAGIIGARGYNGQMQGVAKDCDFLVVKLLQSPNYIKLQRDNKLPPVPVYSNAEVVSAIEFLTEKAKELKKNLVVYFGVGSHNGSHDGYNITVRFINSLAIKQGVVFVAGTGNSGNTEGHTMGVVKNSGEMDTVELNLSKDMKELDIYIWIQKPDRMSLNIIDPAGEELGFFLPKIFSIVEKDFYLMNSKAIITCYDPENFTGHQLFFLRLINIRAGIWKFILKGEYITNGRYDIWLPDETLIPKGTKFLKPVSTTTLTIPSTSAKVVTVAYYDSVKNSIVPSSGKGFNSDNFITPDIAADGINILTTSGTENKIVAVSGSSVATAIVAGVVCLLVQWQSSNSKDTGLYSIKIKSSLIYGANREKMYDYPNEDIGYGKLDLFGVFNTLGGGYRCDEQYIEYYVKNLFIRYPRI